LLQLARVHLDGVPLDLAAELLPLRARFRASVLLHLFLHARSQRRHQADAGRAPGRTFSPRAFRGLIDSLEAAVRRMRPRPGRSAWTRYYEGDSYTPEALEHKERSVDAMLAAAQPNTVWDLGANTGRFSRLAASRGATTVAFDADPAAVEAAYRRAS